MKVELNKNVILTAPPLEVSKAIQRNLKILNPEFVEAEKKGHYTGCIPKYLELYKNSPNGLICPIGAKGMVFEECLEFPVKKITIHDNRRTLNPVNFTFQGELGPLQQEAADLISKHAIRVWEPPTWIKKEIVALYLIAQRKQPTLIVVHSKDLLDEWVDLIEKILGIKAADVGEIAGGKVRMGEKITVAMVQTLHKQTDEVTSHIGHLILDVKTSQVTRKQYLETVEQFDCKYKLWVTPPSYGDVSLDETIKFYVGPTIRKIEKTNLMNNGGLYQGEAFFIPTGFIPVTDPFVNYSHALTEMTQNLKRNRQIAQTAIKYTSYYGFTIILSERQEQCEAIGDLLKHHDCKSCVAVITGETPGKQIQQIMNDLRCGRGSRFLLATNQTIGKVFDLPKIDTLVMATPSNCSSSFLQNIAPAMQPGYGKDRTVVLNFVDDHEVFEDSARTNWETYKQQGLSVFGRIDEWCTDPFFDEDSPFG